MGQVAFPGLSTNPPSISNCVEADSILFAVELERTWVYFIRGGPMIFKVGFSNNIEGRLKKLQRERDFVLSVYAVIPTTFPRYANGNSGEPDLESIIHLSLKKKRISGEWFRLTEDEVRCVVEMYGGWVCNE